MPPVGLLSLSLPTLVGSMVYATTTCNVLDYGGIADNTTDIGPAITRAYTECASKAITSNPADTILLVPQGNYALKTGVLFQRGNYFTLEINGEPNLVFDPDLEGNIFSYELCHHGERYTYMANLDGDIVAAVWRGTGAIHGNGHLWRPNNDGGLNIYPNRPRLLRFGHCNNVDVSGVTLYNAPLFRIVIIGNDNVVHDMKIVADHVGATDGIDITGNNDYVRDVSIENGDECVTIKAPTDGFLAENIQCFYSAGNNIGSFGQDAAVSSGDNVYYRNVTQYGGDGGIVLKSYPSASGVVQNATYEDFKFTNVAYPILISDFWCPHETCPGVTGNLAWKDITFRGITGTGDRDTERPVVEVRCIAGHQCTGIVFEDVVLTKEGGVTPTVYISNACGDGLPELHACN